MLVLMWPFAWKCPFHNPTHCNHIVQYSTVCHCQHTINPKLFCACNTHTHTFTQNVICYYQGIKCRIMGRNIVLSKEGFAVSKTIYCLISCYKRNRLLANFVTTNPIRCDNQPNTVRQTTPYYETNNTIL